MKPIEPPKREDPYPDRSHDCQLALEPAFEDLVAHAHAAGWSKDEITTALFEMSDELFRDLVAERKTQLDIEAAARSVM